MTFMMISSNNGKSDICRFFYQVLFHTVIPYCICTKFHVKWTNISEIQNGFSLRAFFKKLSPGRVNVLSLATNNTRKKFILIIINQSTKIKTKITNKNAFLHSLLTSLWKRILPNISLLGCAPTNNKTAKATRL